MIRIMMVMVMTLVSRMMTMMMLMATIKMIAVRDIAWDHQRQVVNGRWTDVMLGDAEDDCDR